MTPSRRLRVLITIASSLVPRWRRRSWREEWLAELGHASDARAGRRRSVPPTRMAFGAVVDAATVGGLAIRDALSPERRRHAWQGLDRDVRLACRGIGTSPALTLAIVASLAVGLATSTAGFSVLQTMFFRPFPHVQAQEDLLTLCVTRRQGCVASFDDFERFRAHLDTADAVAAHHPVSVAVKLGETPFTTPGAVVSTNYFDILGVRPAAGAFFPGHEAGMTSPVAVISHRLWERELGGREDVAGQTMLVNGIAVRIGGVAPRGFVGIDPKTDGYSPGVWLPTAVAEIALRGDDELPRTTASLGPSYRLDLFARIGHGHTAAQVATQAASLGSAFEPGPLSDREIETGVASAHAPRVTVLPVHLNDPAKALAASTFFTGIPAIVLLIACINAALLFVARASRRVGEWRVRLAIGATRWRLVRQLLVEAMVLATMAGAVGIGLAAVLLRLQEQMIPLPVPIDTSVLVFTTVIIGCTALLFGAGPAWSTANSVVVSPGPLGRYRGRTRARSTLLAVQAAMCVALLATGAQFMRGLQNLAGDAGITNPETLVVANIDLNPLAYSGPAVRAFYTELAERAERLSGVSAIALSDRDYWSRSGVVGSVEILAPAASGGRRGSEVSRVQGNPVATLDLQLVDGRWPRADETAEGPETVVVNTAFERALLDGRALGRTIRVRATPTEASESEALVVGVVKPPPGDARRDNDARPHLYYTRPGVAEPARSLYLRTTSTAEAAAGVRRLVASLDDRVPVEIAPLDQRLAAAGMEPRWIARSTAGLGLLGVFLTAGGLFGIVTYIVAMRTTEIGVRLALGATPYDVITLVVRQAMVPVVVGLMVGTLAAVGVGLLVQSRLYGSESLDLVSLLAASATLLVATCSACLLPALRVSRIAPNTALRATD